MFLSHKLGDGVKSSTVRCYRFPTQSFVDFLEADGVESMLEVDNFHVELWKQQRQREVKLVTVKSNVKQVKTWIGWLERMDMVQPGLTNKITFPNVPDGEQVSDAKLMPGEAVELLNYLEATQRASREHALIALLWHTGVRISGAMALDVSDFHPEAHPKPVLELRDRPETETPLKNGKKSERDVSIFDEDVARVLRDYIQYQRAPVTDEYGREPLFTSKHSGGRISRQIAYKNTVGLTRPCEYTDRCPHGRDVLDCEAAQYKKKAFACPSSIGNHAIRRGSITYQLFIGFPKERLSERVDVSVDVLERHYDARTFEMKRQQRLQYAGLFEQPPDYAELEHMNQSR